MKASLLPLAFAAYALFACDRPRADSGEASAAPAALRPLKRVRVNYRIAEKGKVDESVIDLGVSAPGVNGPASTGITGDQAPLPKTGAPTWS
jgi:hypothetical protein